MQNNGLWLPYFADHALVALTLMIAKSKSDENEMMVKVIVNLIKIKK